MEKQTAGRKKLPDSEKVKMVSAYIKDKHKIEIVKKFGSLTNAVKELIIPKL
jgi:hypothetical protein